MRRDVFPFLVVVSLIKQSEGVSRIYWPFVNRVVLANLNLNEKVKLDYTTNDPFRGSSNPLYGMRG